MCQLTSYVPSDDTDFFGLKTMHFIETTLIPIHPTQPPLPNNANHWLSYVFGRKTHQALECYQDHITP